MIRVVGNAIFLQNTAMFFGNGDGPLDFLVLRVVCGFETKNQNGAGFVSDSVDHHFGLIQQTAIRRE